MMQLDDLMALLTSTGKSEGPFPAAPASGEADAWRRSLETAESAATVADNSTGRPLRPTRQGAQTPTDAETPRPAEPGPTDGAAHHDAPVDSAVAVTPPPSVAPEAVESQAAAVDLTALVHPWGGEPAQPPSLPGDGAPVDLPRADSGTPAFELLQSRLDRGLIEILADRLRRSPESAEDTARSGRLERLAGRVVLDRIRATSGDGVETSEGNPVPTAGSREVAARLAGYLEGLRTARPTAQAQIQARGGQAQVQVQVQGGAVSDTLTAHGGGEAASTGSATSIPAVAQTGADVAVTPAFVEAHTGTAIPGVETSQATAPAVAPGPSENVSVAAATSQPRTATPAELVVDGPVEGRELPAAANQGSVRPETAPPDAEVTASVDREAAPAEAPAPARPSVVTAPATPSELEVALAPAAPGETVATARIAPEDATAPELEPTHAPATDARRAERPAVETAETPEVAPNPQPETIPPTTTGAAGASNVASTLGGTSGSRPAAPTNDEATAPSVGSTHSVTTGSTSSAADAADAGTTDEGATGQQPHEDRASTDGQPAETDPETVDSAAEREASATKPAAVAERAGVRTSGTATSSTTVAAPASSGTAYAASVIGAGSAASTSAAESPTAVVDGAPKVHHQALATAIASRASSVPKDGALELRFALEPEDLGTVRVRIESRGDQMTIRILTSSSAAVDALSPGIARLAAQLTEAGGPQPQIDLGFHEPGEQQRQEAARDRATDEHQPSGTNEETPWTSATGDGQGSGLDRTA